MATYILVVNDVPHATGTTKAAEIVEFLLKKRIWIFPATAPRLKELAVGDTLIVYIAGKAKVFFAEMRIESGLRPLEAALRSEVEQLGLAWFSYSIKISDIKRLNPPRSVRDLILRLKFVTDKKNYGLAFRQGLRRIEDADARVIVGKKSR